MGKTQIGIDSAGRPVYAPDNSSAGKGEAANKLLVSRGIYPTAARTEAVKPYLAQPQYADIVMYTIRVNAAQDGNDVGKPPVVPETPVFPPSIAPETFITKQAEPGTPAASSPLPVAALLAAVGAYFYFK